jgi:Ca2+-binding RTX toxin-like protein
MGVLVATVPATVGAAPAFGAGVAQVVQLPSPEGQVDWTANYSNASGERNVLVVRRGSDGINFNDLSRHAISPGYRCRALASNVASCAWGCPFGECYSIFFVAAVADLGPGDDTFYVAPDLLRVQSAPPVWVNGGAGNDVIYGAGSSPGYEGDRLSGGPGNDVLIAAGPSQISCGAGLDTVIVNSVGGAGVPADCEIVVPQR